MFADHIRVEKHLISCSPIPEKTSGDFRPSSRGASKSTSPRGLHREMKEIADSARSLIEILNTTASTGQ
jgi:hypothetical protein